MIAYDIIAYFIILLHNYVTEGLDCGLSVCYVIEKRFRYYILNEA